MLNKDEELRLAACIDVLQNNSSELTTETQLWLAFKLQECHMRIKLEIENKRSNRPHEDLVIRQAKQLMMVKYDWTEEQAHHFVHRAAMNNRTSKFQIAKKFIEAETQ